MINRIFTKCFLILILINGINDACFAQDIPKKGILFEDAYSGVKIELGIRIPKKACDPNNFKRSVFCLYVTNYGNINRLNQYLNWKMDFINCNGDIIEKTISVDLLASIKNEGQNTNTAWDFDGNAVERDFYNVVNSPSPDYTRDFSKAKALSYPPDSIIGSSSIILGETISLSVSGGSLTKDAKWVWYSGSCNNGTKEGEGSTLIKTNVSKTKVFFVRAEGPRNTTECVYKQVTVDNNSRPADGIEGKSKICNTQSQKKILLYVVGGKKGLNAQWVWYKNNCNAQEIFATGDSIYVNPEKTTTYYVRAEAPTLNPTSCVSHTIEVFEPSVNPSKISVNQQNACSNQPVILSVNDGKISANAKWVWMSKLESNYLQREEGEGEQITVYPDAATTYSVSAQDDICPSTNFVSVRVDVKSLSQDPEKINVEHVKRNWYRLDLVGGQLGENAKWVWYKNSCGGDGEKLSTGETSISYKARKGNNIIYLRGEGDCNNTSCVYTNEYQITKTQKTRKKFGFINGGLVYQTPDNINNMIFTIGSKRVYFSTKLSLEDGANYYYDKNYPNDIYGLSAGSSVELTGKQMYARKSYTGGFMIGGGNVRIFFGGGVGSYQYIREFTLYDGFGGSKTEYAREGMDAVKSSPEAEGGLFLRLGSLTIMGGVSKLFTNDAESSQFMDGHVSIGFKF